MTYDLTILGIYIHPLIVTAVIALALSEGISWSLKKLGAYPYIWNPGLFDVSVAFILWTIISLPLGSI
jgi:hypothetical protein